MSIRSSSVRSDACSGGSMAAVHVLVVARVILEDDNEKKPLWRYLKVVPCQKRKRKTEKLSSITKRLDLGLMFPLSVKLKKQV